MARIAVGVHGHAEPDRLAATLRSLRAHTAADVDIVLLPDGADAEMRAALARYGDIAQYGTDEPRGAAACLNRLAAARAGAELLVLLESGCRVGPRWLELLVAGLESDPRNGLAGPSTNVAWNEQSAFPRAGDGDAAIHETARLALSRYGAQARTLEPLYSLADFCYLVRRAVLEAVGPADEGYGLGPCWEMDYNARAARAGFRGVWVGAAYVHRAPFTERRRREEAARFEASKRRYQDRLCGEMLRGVRSSYRNHCRGDACPNFAPPSLIGIGPRAQGVMSDVTPITISAKAAAAISQTTAKSPNIGAAISPPANHDTLISCIMPTFDRRPFVPLAIRCFLAQDHPSRELVIVDDGTDPIRDLVPDDPRIRYVRQGGRRILGAKRNLACELARGDVIAHWDDDDWSPPWRLRVSLAALAAGADVCGTSTAYFYEPDTDRAWLYRYGGQDTRILVGTSLVYRRRAWERARFADVQVGEDVRFLGVTGMRVADLADPSLAVATIHRGNTSPRWPGGAYWSEAPALTVHRLVGDDLALWRGARIDAPLVSCIMPTRDRRAFVRLSLRHFLAQDHPRKELIVVDDGGDAVEDVVAGAPGVRYLRLGRRATIGGKRNFACREARGSIICHWDDDDWYAPERLRRQIAPIVEGRADMTGLEGRLLLQLPEAILWSVNPELHRRMFVGDVHGGTIAYRRALLDEGMQYPEVDLAEDAALIRQALLRGRRLERISDPSLFVYMRHGTNAWRFEPGKSFDPSGWRRAEPPAAMPPDLIEQYRSAATGDP